MVSGAFLSPFDVETPASAAGWEEMYSWYHLYSEDHRAEEEGRFWFQDRLHNPDPIYPYDEVIPENWWRALGAFNTRIFAMPPAFGVDQRILLGRLYLSPIGVEDEAVIQARAQVFRARAQHYYDHWDAIYEAWKKRLGALLDDLRSLSFAPLPDLEDESVVFEHRGYSTGFEMVRSFDRLIAILFEAYEYHFELLNIGYAAYLALFDFCRRAFPDIADTTIAQMVAGEPIELYRPDDELRRLAEQAHALGLSDVVQEATSWPSLERALADSEAGRTWKEHWADVADPWFRIATDPGHPAMSHAFPTWLEDQTIPLRFVQEYLRLLASGRSLERSTESTLTERSRLASEYAELLAPQDRAAFGELLDLARKVSVYIEEHVLYVEHWITSTFWAKSRELGRTLAGMGCFDDPEDLFYLRRLEVAEALYESVAAWAVGRQGVGGAHWRPLVARRRALFEALKELSPPPAVGRAPEAVNEPFTVMLWGITPQTVAQWLAQGDERDEAIILGSPAAPGVAEGPARIIRDLSQLREIEPGDVLVCPATSPSWSPVFVHIAATVSDVGGVMSHTAIVCREYGLPAVVGTGDAVQRIRTGQRVRVDGDAGTVTILGEPEPAGRGA